MKKQIKDAIRQGIHRSDCAFGEVRLAVDEIYEALLEAGVVEPDPEPREFWIRGTSWYFSKQQAEMSLLQDSSSETIHVKEVIGD